MVRSLAAAACLLLLIPAVPASAQQQPPPGPQQPVPDTKPARERHRIQEKEPPPPEGPWGPEEFGFTWHKPVWRGLTFTAGTYSGGSMAIGGEALAASSDGVNPPVFERLEYDSESFRTTSFSLGVDLDMIRLSLSFFHGDFDAQGDYVRDNGVTVTRTPLSFDGTAYGFRTGVYWPAFRYRDTLLELSAGPIATVGWHHQEVDDLPGPLLTHDAVDVLTGSIGPKASLRGLFGNVEVELNAEYSFTAGSLRGWTKEFSVGVGLHF